MDDATLCGAVPLLLRGVHMAFHKVIRGFADLHTHALVLYFILGVWLNLILKLLVGECLAFPLIA